MRQSQKPFIPTRYRGSRLYVLIIFSSTSNYVAVINCAKIRERIPLTEVSLPLFFAANPTITNPKTIIKSETHYFALYFLLNRYCAINAMTTTRSPLIICHTLAAHIVNAINMRADAVISRIAGIAMINLC